MLGPHHSLLLQLRLNDSRVVEATLEARAVVTVDELFAAGAVEEVELHARSHPLLVENLLDTVFVEDMTTS